MDQDGVFPSYFVLELADGFKERLAFDVSHGASYFNNGNPCFRIGKIPVKPAFNFVRNMGNHLNGAAAVIPPAFFLEDGPVDFSGCDVGIPVQIFVDEPFVMP